MYTDTDIYIHINMLVMLQEDVRDWDEEQDFRLDYYLTPKLYTTPYLN
jgi:hypothetical protein